MKQIAINDTDEPVSREEYWYDNGKRKRKIVWRCPFYVTWSNMIKRACSQDFKNENPTYEDVSVCIEWLMFSKFKEWMSNQNWEGMHLDKDILSNSKVYSPESCVFVNHKTNTFLLDSKSRRGKYKLGVNRKGSSYAACINENGKSRHLGTFKTEQEAHEAWRIAKFEQAVVLSESQTDKRVAEAIIERYKL